MADASPAEAEPSVVQPPPAPAPKEPTREPPEEGGGWDDPAEVGSRASRVPAHAPRYAPTPPSPARAHSTPARALAARAFRRAFAPRRPPSPPSTGSASRRCQSDLTSTLPLCSYSRRRCSPSARSGESARRAGVPCLHNSLLPACSLNPDPSAYTLRPLPPARASVRRIQLTGSRRICSKTTRREPGSEDVGSSD
jgi:hypothetical protein